MFKRIDLAIRQDLVAGFIVFLVALPLCVGISIASSAPPTAGIITAIVGGIVGAIYSGSYLTINGPAAGLIVIVAACVEELGGGILGYQGLLAATVIAGSIQLVLGFLRAGSFGLAFPGSVVHGMLAAIGIIIISKQLYVMLGIAATTSKPLELLAGFPQHLLDLNFEVAAIGLTCLLIMITLNMFAKKSVALKMLPIPLVAVLIGIFLAQYWDFGSEHLVETLLGQCKIGPNFLLNVPNSLSGAIFFPDFFTASPWLLLKHGLIIAFVASTESILSALAVDRLDVAKRSTDLNKELKSKGVCNIIAASIGGLPMIAEIVRSSANISYGAKSQLSNFSHGVFLLAFLGLFPNLLHKIPLATLAAILVYIGFQLSRPRHFFGILEKGKDQAFIFVLTIFSILAIDLLSGVLIGTLAEFFLISVESRTLNLFKFKHSLSEKSDHTVIEVSSPVSFSNYLTLRNNIEKFHKNRLTIDLRRSKKVDTTVTEHLQQYSKSCEGSDKEFNVIFPKN